MAHNASVTDSDMSSDIEKHSRRSVQLDAMDKDVEMQGVEKLERSEDADVEASRSSDDSHGDEVEVEETGFQATLDRVLSRASAKTMTPGPPPDGGLQAWIVVLCTHLVIMNTWGFINTFGIFQSYYTTALAASPQAVSWIGSVQVFFLFSIGTFTGQLTDAGYFRALFLVGSLLQVAGLFATAAATTYWQVFLAQGVCMGLANGCLFCPAVAVLSTYWRERRGLAIGIAACGSATGGLVFPSVVRELLPRVGFAWSVRTIGFITLVTMVVANVGIRPRIPPRKNGKVVDWAAFKEKEYSFYAAGSFFLFMGVYIAFFYLASFSRDIIGLPYASSLDLLLVINGAGTFGRLGPNYIADRWAGALTTFVVVGTAAGVFALAWTGVHAVAGLYVWAVFYGAVAGGIQSIFPLGLSSLTSDLAKLGVRMGMVFTIVGFATLAGPPIAGALIAGSGGGYMGAQVFAGMCLLVGGAFIVAAREARRRKLGLGWKGKV